MFTTYPSSSTSEACPNAHVRQQTGAALLPDCRAYELVSAANSGGYDVESNLVAGQEPYGGFPERNPPASSMASTAGPFRAAATRPTGESIPMSPPAAKTVGRRGMWASRPATLLRRTVLIGPPAPTRTSTLAFSAPGGCSPCFADGSTGIPVHLADGVSSRAWRARCNPARAQNPTA